MKIIRTVLTISAVLLIGTSVVAAPASDESVATLLELAQVQTTMDSMTGGYEKILREGLNQTYHERGVSIEQQKVLDGMVPKFVALLREEMNWAKLKPLYIASYQETFDQAEIDGLIQFYKSAAGRSFVKKMPVLQDKTAALTQAHIRALVPKIKTAVADALVEARSAK